MYRILIALVPLHWFTSPLAWAQLTAPNPSFELREDPPDSRQSSRADLIVLRHCGAPVGLTPAAPQCLSTISSVPSTCYIDGARTLRDCDVGLSHGKEKEIEKKIKQLLQ